MIEFGNSIVSVVYVLVFWLGGIWESWLHDQESKPPSPELEGKVLTTGLPGKSLKSVTFSVT